MKETINSIIYACKTVLYDMFYFWFEKPFDIQVRDNMKEYGDDYEL